MKNARQIVVVDDDVDFADSVVDLLCSEGHRVQVAYSGHAAVETARTCTFDLTLMDMQMPGIDGVGSLRRVLDHEPTARVVRMTGFSMPERLDDANSIGAAGLLQKPLDMDRLHALIDDATAPFVVLGAGAT